MSDCVTTPSGTSCPAPSDWSTCRPWDITEQTQTNCYIDSVTQDALEIAGAKVNVYKLLGVHEQTKLVDLVGNGKPISGGDAVGFPATNAFTSFATEWRSKQSGIAAITSSAYIGYDFGVPKVITGRQRYGIDASIRQHITTIKIKQSANPLARVNRARVERSEDGISWYGVAVVTLPNDDQLNAIHFKHSVPSRYWRLRPVGFVGTTCENWGVQALEMFDYSVTHVSNIEDKILMENRNRNYQQTPVLLKGYYDLQGVQTDLQRLGIATLPVSYQIKLHFTSTVSALGRPVVIGDIIELPSEMQYTPDLRPVKKYLEVTDVAWDPGSYTPGWVPTMLLVTAEPAIASQETQDLFGDLSKAVDTSGLFDTDDGNNTVYQDFSAVDQTIKAEALNKVPERGADASNEIREFEQSVLDENANKFPHLKRYGLNRTGLHVEDAVPPNNAPYTEGPTPPSDPSDGDYHRLTYTGLAKHIPARLIRWSTTKGRWLYLETDKRAQFNATKPLLEEYTRSDTKVFASETK